MARLLLLLLLFQGWTAASGQPGGRVTYYDEEDGLPHGHVTQLLQDSLGFMWFATWNGLCRYDGHEFRTFKATAGDGCHMTTDRFRDIALRPDGNILCRVDDYYYLFDTRRCRFSDLPAAEAARAADQMRQYRMSDAWKGDNRMTGFTYTDRQGNRWSVRGTGIYKETPLQQHTWRLGMEPGAEVKCLFKDRQQRYWVCTKGDGAVRVYATADNRLLGYLGADGRLHAAYTRFGHAVYCMHQSADGTLWMGTKPDGLFRLRPTGGAFTIDHITDLPNPNVYSIAEDRYGRMWVATLGGGLCFTTDARADSPLFRVPRHYPRQQAQRLRYLCMAENGDILLAAATDGLMVARLTPDADAMTFRLHQRESMRAESLSSSALMDIMADGDGHYYVSTESGGINRTQGTSLSDSLLAFRHYTVANHQLPTDVVLSMTPLDGGRVMVVSNHLVSVVDSSGHYRQVDARYFNEDYRFSDAHPLRLGGDRWLFGLTDGAFMTTTAQMLSEARQPALVLTAVSVQGGSARYGVSRADSIVLLPHERSVTIHFAALDYSAPERINYAFRLLPGSQWNHIGTNRSVTLLDLKPRTYQLEIRCTNADGQWTDSLRRLTIVVQPTFWESAVGRLLMVLLVVAMLAVIVYTYLYIRRIKRQQHETLEAYLALMEKQAKPRQRREKVVTDDPMMQRVMAFIEANIGNGDAGIGDMAAAAATSRSGLQRKLKQTMGITPQDLLREARIKHACLLLSETDKTVAEVAYACGFSDPKYFSRSFKQSTGLSPTEYKNTI